MWLAAEEGAVRSKGLLRTALIALALALLSLALLSCQARKEERELRIGLLIPLSNTPDRFI